MDKRKYGCCYNRIDKRNSERHHRGGECHHLFAGIRMYGDESGNGGCAAGTDNGCGYGMHRRDDSMERCGDRWRMELQ